jgi:flavin-dependent dehydrogenase
VTECDVGIVGGGVAGAGAACAFAAAGVSVVLFERRDLARDRTADRSVAPSHGEPWCEARSL